MFYLRAQRHNVWRAFYIRLYKYIYYICRNRTAKWKAGMVHGVSIRWWKCADRTWNGAKQSVKRKRLLKENRSQAWRPKQHSPLRCSFFLFPDLILYFISSAYFPFTHTTSLEYTRHSLCMRIHSFISICIYTRETFSAHKKGICKNMQVPTVPELKI